MALRRWKLNMIGSIHSDSVLSRALTAASYLSFQLWLQPSNLQTTMRLMPSRVPTPNQIVSWMKTVSQKRYDVNIVSHTDLILIISTKFFCRSKSNVKNRLHESIIYTIHCESRFSLIKIMLRLVRIKWNFLLMD